MLVALALAVPVGRSAEALHLGPPLVDRVDYEGNAWVAYAVSVQDGGAFRIGIEPTVQGARMASFGVWVVANETNFGAIVITAARSGTEVVVSEETAGTLVQAGERKADTDGLEPSFVYVDAEGDFTLVAATMHTGGTSSGNFFLGASDEVSVRSRTTGASAVLFEGEDLSPKTYGAATVVVPATNLQAEVVRDGRVELEVEHSLFGWLYAGHGASSYTTPEGSSRPAGPHSPIFTKGSEGLYEFDLAVTVDTGPQWFWGADVLMPTF